MRFKTPYNADLFPRFYDPSGGVSMTIPDQTMSLREIMRRFNAGLPIEGVKVPLYDDEDAPLVDIATLDLAEREAAAREAREELDSLKDRIKEAQQQARQAYYLGKAMKEAEKKKAAEAAKNSSNEQPGTE